MSLTDREIIERKKKFSNLHSYDISQLQIEQGYINNFIDKTEGSSMPDYDNENYISDSDSIVTSISKLDAELLSSNSNISTLQTEVQNLEDMSDHSMDTSDIVKTPLMATVTYDYSVDGGNVGDITLNNNTEMIPDNAIITLVIQDVITSPNSTTNTGTIKFKLPTDGDLTSNITADGSTSGLVAGICDMTVGNMIKSTDSRTIQVEVGNENLTAGKIKLYVYYVKSE